MYADQFGEFACGYWGLEGEPCRRTTFMTTVKPLLSGHLYQAISINFTEVPTNYLLLSSPLLNDHFEKTYHISATGRTVYDVKLSLTFLF